MGVYQNLGPSKFWLVRTAPLVAIPLLGPFSREYGCPGCSISTAENEFIHEQQNAKKDVLRNPRGVAPNRSLLYEGIWTIQAISQKKPSKHPPAKTHRPKNNWARISSYPQNNQPNQPRSISVITKSHLRCGCGVQWSKEGGIPFATLPFDRTGSGGGRGFRSH